MVKKSTTLASAATHAASSHNISLSGKSSLFFRRPTYLSTELAGFYSVWMDRGKVKTMGDCCCCYCGCLSAWQPHEIISFPGKWEEKERERERKRQRRRQKCDVINQPRKLSFGWAGSHMRTGGLFFCERVAGYHAGGRELEKEEYLYDKWINNSRT